MSMQILINQLHQSVVVKKVVWQHNQLLTLSIHNTQWDTTLFFFVDQICSHKSSYIKVSDDKYEKVGQRFLSWAWPYTKIEKNWKSRIFTYTHGKSSSSSSSSCRSSLHVAGLIYDLLHHSINWIYESKEMMMVSISHSERILETWKVIQVQD